MKVKVKVFNGLIGLVVLKAKVHKVHKAHKEFKLRKMKIAGSNKNVNIDTDTGIQRIHRALMETGSMHLLSLTTRNSTIMIVICIVLVFVRFEVIVVVVVVVVVPLVVSICGCPRLYLYVENVENVAIKAKQIKHWVSIFKSVKLKFVLILEKSIQFAKLCLKINSNLSKKLNRDHNLLSAIKLLHRRYLLHLLPFLSCIIKGDYFLNILTFVESLRFLGNLKLKIHRPSLNDDNYHGVRIPTLPHFFM